MNKCEYCFRMVDNDELKTIQIIKWEKETTKGIRKVCKKCREWLKGQYYIPKGAEK